MRIKLLVKLLVIVLCISVIQLTYAQQKAHQNSRNFKKIKSAFLKAEKKSVASFTGNYQSVKQESAGSYESAKAQICTTDTASYTRRLGELWGHRNNIMSSGVLGYGMGFKLKQPAQIYGFRFYAVLKQTKYKKGKKAPVIASIYTYQNGITGVLLASTNVHIGGNIDNSPMRMIAEFSSPITVSDSFYLTLESINTSEIVVDFTVLGTSLLPTWGILKLSTGWFKIETALRKREEPNFHPIIDYSVTANFEVNGIAADMFDTVYAQVGQNLNFVNTSSPIFFNYMFSYRYIHPGDMTAWDFGDGGQSNNAFDANHIYSNPGVYEVVMTDYLERYYSFCVEAQTITVVVDPAINKSGIASAFENMGYNKSNSEILVYPNPNKGNFNIALSNLVNERAEIFITDMYGKVIIKKELNPGISKNLPLDLSQHNKGIYFVSFISEDGTILSKKVLVQ